MSGVTFHFFEQTHLPHLSENTHSFRPREKQHTFWLLNIKKWQPVTTCVVFPDFHFFLEHDTELIIGILEDEPGSVCIETWMKVFVDGAPQTAIFFNGILLNKIFWI